MKLKELTLKDKPLIRRFLDCRRHGLAVYAFENIYIWKALFKIQWALIDRRLCVFFRDKTGCFLYLPPLGAGVSPGAISASFRIMDDFNTHQGISRIENIEEEEKEAYQGLGLRLVEKPGDYLCSRSELEGLKGNRFKSKRADFNYFVKHYPYEYREFSLKYHRECIDLYDLWSSQRMQDNQDKVYRGMIQDNRRCLEFLLKDYRKLEVRGRIVQAKDRIAGFTFGFGVNPAIFCVLYEITDLRIKGLAQFIFRKFAGDLRGYRYLNIMDDSGLEGLKRVKLSYRPLKLVKAYIAQR